MDFFFCAKIDSRKARERELAKFDENRRAVGMLNPLRDKNEGTYRGGEGTTSVTTACLEIKSETSEVNLSRRKSYGYCVGRWYSGHPDLRALRMRAFGTCERSNRHGPPIIKAMCFPLHIRAKCG